MTHKSYKHLIVCLSQIFMVASAAIGQTGELDSSAFGKVPASTLCFDLRRDNEILAGLMLPISGVSVKSDHTYILPFRTSHPGLNEDLLARWGGYDQFSIITVTVDPSKPGVHGVSFKPSFSDLQDPSPVFTELDNCLYYIDNGLERRFIYKYPEIGKTLNLWKELKSSSNASDIRYIGLVIPQKAKGSEIGSSGKTAIPEHETTSGKAKLYPADKKHAGQHDALRVSFQLPPSKGQKIFGEYATKLLIGILAPVIALILLRPTGIQQKRRRTIALFIVLGLQTIIVISLFVLAIIYWNEDKLRSILDIVVALIATVITAYAAWEKEKSDKSVTPEEIA